MNASLKQYSVLYEDLINYDKELKRVMKEKAEAEAKNLWDQA